MNFIVSIINNKNELVYSCYEESVSEEHAIETASYRYFGDAKVDFDGQHGIVKKDNEIYVISAYQFGGAK